MGLALGLREGERVFLGDDIAFTVIKATPNYTRVVIEAPKDMPIVREKIADEAIKSRLLTKDHQELDTNS